jgi:hypothetical protein
METPSLKQLSRERYIPVLIYNDIVLSSVRSQLRLNSGANLRQNITRAIVLRSRKDYLQIVKSNLHPTAFKEKEKIPMMQILLQDWLERWEDRIAIGFRDGVERRIGSIVLADSTGDLIAQAKHDRIIESDHNNATVSLFGNQVMLKSLVLNGYQGDEVETNFHNPNLSGTIDEGIYSWAKEHEQDRERIHRIEAGHILNICDVAIQLGFYQPNSSFY